MEARGHFGDAAGALGDDDEIHDDQDREHDDADDEIAAHDEIAERLDDMAGSGGAFVAVSENEPRRGQIERKPQHGRDQEDGGKSREFERRVNEQRRHQDQHRESDRYGEREIEQERRQRQDEDDEDRHHAERQSDVAAPKHGAEIGEPPQGRLAALRRRRVAHAVRSGASAFARVQSFARRPLGHRREEAEPRSSPRLSPKSVRVGWKRFSLPGKMCRVYGY